MIPKTLHNGLLNSWSVDMFLLNCFKTGFLLTYSIHNELQIHSHFGFWVLCIVWNAALVSDKNSSVLVCHFIYFSWQVRQFLRDVSPDESLSFRSAPCWVRRSTMALCLEWSPPGIFNKLWRGVWPFLSWMFTSAPAEINSWTNSKCCVTAKWLLKTAQWSGVLPLKFRKFRSAPPDINIRESSSFL